MLVLSRRRDETIRISDDVTIVVVDIRGDSVRIGIEAPRDIPVHRGEVYDEIQADHVDTGPPSLIVAPLTDERKAELEAAFRRQEWAGKLAVIGVDAATLGECGDACDCRFDPSKVAVSYAPFATRDSGLVQIEIGPDGRIAISQGWAKVANGPIQVGDRVVVQGTHTKWWLSADRAPGEDASDHELVIRKLPEGDG